MNELKALPGKVVVAGGGGFIGGHLVSRLLSEGYEVRSVDCKPLGEWFQVFADAENLQLDLMGLDECRKAVDGMGTVFNLAADMGGMGFIELNKAACMLSVLTSTHMLMAARDARRRAVLLLLVCLRVRRRPPAGPERRRAQGA